MMNDIPQALSDKTRASLDRYLDAVDAVLIEAGVSRLERHSICDEIESQACEMAWQRAGGEPTQADVAAVVAELDPPEAFGEDVNVHKSKAAAVERKIHPWAMTAFMLLPVGIGFCFTPYGPHSVAGSYLGILWFTSALLAVLAIVEIRKQPARYSGIGIAMAGPLLLPFLTGMFLLIFNLAEVNPMRRQFEIAMAEQQQDYEQRRAEITRLEAEGKDTSHISTAFTPAAQSLGEIAAMYAIDIALVAIPPLVTLFLFVLLKRRFEPAVSRQ